MAGPGQKSQRISTLIKVRKFQFDQDFLVLNEIKSKHFAAVEQLHLAQKNYMDGVEKLNQERQSPERKMLQALELGVDMAKNQWYQRLMTLRIVEEEERRQLQQTAEAQRRLRMLEKLDERYNQQDIEHYKTIEQNQLDEFALQTALRKVSS